MEIVTAVPAVAPSVTQRDDPIAIYAAGLRTEARLVAETIGQRMPVSHVHFGGGTPTVMSPEAFVDLVGALRYSFSSFPMPKSPSRSIRAH